jgi:hypothetical protein
LPKARLAVESMAVGMVPVPLSATTCGDVAALSVISRFAVRLPVDPGVNTTPIVQLAPAATLAPQLLVTAKSEALVPLDAMDVIVKAADPLLVRVTLWLALAVPMFWPPKARAVVDSATAGAATPVPLSATAWGEVGALSAMVTLAVRFPAIVGVNITVTVQVPAGAMLLPTQVFVLLKSPGLVPVMLTALTVKAAFPLFVTVISWLALVVPMFWLAKVRLAGESATPGAAGGVFSIAMICPPRRMYSFEGLDGSVLCAGVSEVMVRNSRARQVVRFERVIVSYNFCSVASTIV